MARVNKCKVCQRTEGVEWVGTNHNLCRDCCDERQVARQVAAMAPKPYNFPLELAALFAAGMGRKP